MNGKTTPPPWEYQEIEDTPEKPESPGYRYFIYSSGEPAWPVGVAMTRYDAHLMVYAPQMLEILKTLYLWAVGNEVEDSLMWEHVRDLLLEIEGGF